MNLPHNLHWIPVQQTVGRVLYVMEMWTVAMCRDFMRDMQSQVDGMAMVREKALRSMYLWNKGKCMPFVQWLRRYTGENALGDFARDWLDDCEAPTVEVWADVGGYLEGRGACEAALVTARVAFVQWELA